MKTKGIIPNGTKSSAVAVIADRTACSVISVFNAIHCDRSVSTGSG